MSRRTWIFDLDGTLIDSMGSLTHLATEILARTYALPAARARELYRQTSGRPFVEQVAQLFPNDARNAAAVEQFESTKRTQYLDTPAFPEVADTLALLRVRGDFLAVSSNNMQDLVEQIVKQQQLPVHCALGYHNGVGKGAAHFAQIQSQSGSAGDTLHFIGDSLHDAALARELHIPFTARVGTFTHEEFTRAYASTRTITNLSELLS